MTLSDEQIKSFQDIYRRQFGKEISREEALEQGIKLVRLMRLIYQPMTENEQQQLQTRRNQT